MKIRAVEAELFHADGRTDGHTDRNDAAQSLFAILRTRLKRTPYMQTTSIRPSVRYLVAANKPLVGFSRNSIGYSLQRVVQLASVRAPVGPVTATLYLRQVNEFPSALRTLTD